MIQIKQGDCLEVLKTIPNNSFDALVTDPPYGIGYKYNNKKEETSNPEDYWKWLKPRYEEALRCIKPGGFVAVWQTQKYFKYFWDWFGNNIHIYISCKNWVQIYPNTEIVSAYDPIIVFYKKGANPLWPDPTQIKFPFTYKAFDYYVANTTPFRNKLIKKHPSPRPLDQCVELLYNFVIDNGKVLDPFCGSSTIGEAAVATKRSYLGIDIEPLYLNISVERIYKIFNLHNIDKLNLEIDFEYKPVEL